jgi:hypothetical protein
VIFSDAIEGSFPGFGIEKPFSRRGAETKRKAKSRSQRSEIRGRKTEDVFHVASDLGPLISDISSFS